MRWARTLAALGALALVFRPDAAAAQQQNQTTLINTPAESFAMAPGGVDMRTGRYVYNETDLSIGGEGGLTLARTMSQNIPGHGSPFGNLSHNWDITVSEKIEDPGSMVQRMFVNFGGRSQTFQRSGSGTGFAASPGPTQSLTYTGALNGPSLVFTYTAPDGSVALFRPLGTLGNGGCSHLRRCANIAQLTETDGTIYTFDYAANESGPAGGTERLRSVISSRGYALLLEGTESRVTKACIVNLSLGALPATCPPNALASASYTYTGATYAYDPSSPVIFWTRRLASATGPDNATSSFSYGSGTMALIRPGESNAWQTLTVGEGLDEQDVIQPIVSAQSFADGLTYSYNFYTGPVTNNQPNPGIAGGSYSYNDGEVRTVNMPYGFPLAYVSGNPGYPCIPPSCEMEPPSDGFQNWIYEQTPGPVSVTDQLGRTTIFNYCNPQGAACDVMPLVSFTDPEGAVTELRYDGRGNIDRVTRHPRPGSALANIVTSAVYDIYHPRSQTRPLSMTDARGNVTDYTYAPEHGGMLTMTGPAVNGVRPQTRNGYTLRKAWLSNGAGGYVQAATGTYLLTATSSCRTSAASTTGAYAPCSAAGDEVLTSYDYGPDSGPNTLLLRGQAVTSTDGGVATTLRTCYAYDALGRKISETAPNANLAACPATPPTTALPYTGSTRYDAGNRVTGTISADPDAVGSGNPFLAVRTSYDPAGRPIKVETGRLATWQSEAVAPSAWTGFSIDRTAETQYDAMGRKQRDWVREGPAGTVRTLTEYKYDLVGRLTCTAVRMNPAAFVFTPAPPNACVPNAAGTGANDFGPDRITQSIYDAAGQVTQLREGVGSNVEAAVASFSYNLAGQRTVLVDGNGNPTAFQYDGHGRLMTTFFPNATGGGLNWGDYEARGYDAAGNVIYLVKRDLSTITYQFDALNRMILKVVPDRAGLDAAHERDVYYGYDLRGLQLFARFDSASGEGVTSAYDGFGRQLSQSINLGGTARTLAYQYDRNGTRTRLTHPDGTAFGTVLDAGSRPIELRENPAGANALLTTITYDPQGRPWILTRGAGMTITTFDYHAIGRLLRQGHNLAGGATNDLVLEFGYNPAGGIAQASRDNDLYAWAGHYAVNRAYTTNGLNQYTAAGGATLTYDTNGNLTGDGTNTFAYDIENRLVGRSGVVALTYDPLGRLWRVAGPSSDTLFLYDGDALVAEYNPGGTVLRRYVHGAGADVPLIWYEGATLTDRRYLHADERGSIVAVADANGALIGANRYDEYGIPAATNIGRFQYTGQIWLPELGMYHYKARVYSPYLGRFLQTDSIGYDGGFNLYAYVNDDPVNLVDPDGEQPTPSSTARPARPRLGPVNFSSSFNGLSYGRNVRAAQSIWRDVPISPSARSGSNPGYTAADVGYSAGLIRTMQILGPSNFGRHSQAQNDPLGRGFSAVLYAARFEATPSGVAQWHSTGGTAGRDWAYWTITGRPPVFGSNGASTGTVSYGGGLTATVTAYRDSSRQGPAIEFIFRQRSPVTGSHIPSETVLRGKIRF